MSFKNVEIKKKANVYHDGKVTSRTIITPEGEMKTLGVMLPGTYRFSTQAPEKIDITGALPREARRPAELERVPGGAELLGAREFALRNRSHRSVRLRLPLRLIGGEEA